MARPKTFLGILALTAAMVLPTWGPLALGVAADESKPKMVIQSYSSSVSPAAVQVPGGMQNIPPEALKHLTPEILKKMPPEMLEKIPLEIRERILSGESPDKAETPEKKPDEKKDKPDGEKGKPEDNGDKEKESGEDPAAEKRPDEPAESADPEELEVRPDEEGKIRLNFTGQPWRGVLEWLADISAMSLDWQELPGGYLNLTTQRSYTVEEVRDLINRHLLARGYTLLQHGEVLSVADTKKLDLGMVPRVAPEQLQQRNLHEFVKVSFPLDWLMAETAVEEFKPMLSPNGKLTALRTTNRIEAVDAVVNLLEIYRLLSEEQSAKGQDRLIREFELQYARAEDVREQLEALLGIESKRGGPKMPMTPQQMEQAKQQAQMMAKMRQQQQGKKGAPSPPKPAGKVNLVVNQRKNSILAHAPPDKMAIIEQAVKALDVPSDPTRSLLANMTRMQVYRLQTMEPQPLITTLEELADLDPNTRLESDTQNKAIIAYAPLADHVTIRTLVDKLDGSGRRSMVIQLQALDAESVAETIDFIMGGGKKKEDESRSRNSFFDRIFGSRSGSRSSRQSSGGGDQFRVDADAKNNALLLWANEFEVAKVEELLENLRTISTKGSESATVRVYRLAAIDPEPLVKTLEDMDTLDPRAALEVDEKNNAIIARAFEADHETIRALVDELDGSGRKFEVIRLRRLEADYVAGSIEFMMAGAEKEQRSDGGRSRYYFDPFDDYRSRGDGDKKSSDKFRVDADVEHNRLLLWANEIELEEVRNLLVKLGEIPPAGDKFNTIRVIDTLDESEVQELLERLRRAWPSVAPNPLVLPPAQESDEAPEKAAPEEKPESPASATPETTTQARRPIVRFAQLRQEETVKKPAAEPEKPAEKKSPPPITITRGVDGRLTITSEDTQALDLLEELIADMAPRRKDYKIFKLKYAWAYGISLNLKDFFDAKSKTKRTSPRYDYYYYREYGGDRDQEGARNRLSKRRELKFISDTDTNSIIVQNADAEQLKQIEELIEFYDKPEPSDSQSVRMTQVIPIRYSKARVVADAVKDVYRDLLSSRDKAFAKGQQQQKQRPDVRYMYVYDADGETNEQKTPKFKGLLSIGVDELSNTLIVSAPKYFFENVTRMIEQLDEAAKPTTTTVTVRKVSPGMTADKVRGALADVFGEGASSKGPDKRPAAPKPENGAPKRPKPPNGPRD